MTDHLKASPPERYEEISRHLPNRAQQELGNGDILQASDKVWGATAHAVKAVCQKMDWTHHSHFHLRPAANYVASGLGRDDLSRTYGFLDALHTNYYEHQRNSAEIRVGIDSAAYFVREFTSALVSELPGNQEHLSEFERADQERLLRMLTRKTPFLPGHQTEGEELESLPPVKPSVNVSGDSDAD